MQIKNFHLPVREIIPKLNGEFPQDMNVHAPPEESCSTKSENLDG